MIVNTGLRRFIGEGGDGQPTFLADFIANGGIGPSRGSSPTYTRATTATITDHDLIVRNCLSGEARFGGFRRVQNLLSATEALAGAPWVVSGSGAVTSGFSDPDGGSTAFRIVTSTTAINSGINQATTNPGGTRTDSVWLRGEVGGEQVQFGDSSVRNTVTLTTSWRRYSGSSAFSSGFTVIYSNNLAQTWYVWHPQLENVTGQTNQNPAKYVSVGVLSAPFHGANVDGVKYFPYLNGNTVASNVVTEATGPHITGNSNIGALPGVSGSYFSTPDSAAASITGDIDIRVKVALNDWTPAATSTLLGKYDAAGNQQSYLLQVLAAGTLIFYTSSSGTASTSAISSVATGLADGSTKWVRATRASASGQVIFYLSDDGVTWNQLGTPQTNTAGAIFDGTALVTIGAFNNAGTGNPAAGRVYRAQIYSGIDGTLAVDFNPNSWTSGTTWASATTETWTINGTAAVIPVSLGGYLAEAAATNLCLQSNAFTTTWVTFGTPDATQNVTGPDGIANSAWTLTDNDPAAYEGIQQAWTIANDSLTHTFAIYVKKTSGGTSSTFGYNVDLSGGTPVNLTPRINTDLGTFLGGTGTNSVIEDAGQYWRVSSAAANNATGNVTLTILISPALSAYNTFGDTVAATGSQVIWGAQLIKANTLGLINSYIPTTTASVTRNADSLIYSTTGWLNAAAGTLYVEWFNSSNNASSGAIAGLSDGTANNIVRIYRSSTGTAAFADVVAASITQSNLSATSLSLGAVAKAVSIYQANDFAAFANNTSLGTDVSGTVPTVTQLEVGMLAGAQTRHYIRKVAYNPVRMQSVKAQRLTQ